jgi:hypothetical protein
MEQKMCIVLGKPYNTQSLLLDKRMKDSLENNTITGWGISPEVQEKIDEGFVALIEINEEKSTVTDGKILPENAYRTGVVAYLKKIILFNLVPNLPEDIPFIFVAEDFIPGLQKLQENAEPGTSEEKEDSQ